MTEIFISYKREERADAERIARALSACGYTVWWDAEMSPGEEYRQRTLEVLRTCKAAIVMWSQQSVRSGWVLDEAQRAKDRGVLVPVMIDPVNDDLPLGFGQLHTHTLIGWDGEVGHALFKPVITALDRLAGKRRRSAPASAKGAAGSDAEEGARGDNLNPDVAFWLGVKDSRRASDVEAYLSRFPQGVFADLARERLKSLQARPGLVAGLAGALPKLDGIRTAMASAGANGAPLRRADLAFILAVAVIIPFLAWPFVNIAIGAASLFWGPDFERLFDFTNFAAVYYMAPLLTALMWIYDHVEGWAQKAGALQRRVLRIGVGLALAVWFVLGVREGSFDEGASAHLALWTGLVWLASFYARAAGPRLRRLFAPT